MTTTQNNDITVTTQYFILKGDIEVIKQHKNFGYASAFMNSENKIRVIQTYFSGSFEDMENEDDEVLNVLHEHKFDYVMLIFNDYPDGDHEIIARKIEDGNDEELEDDEYYFYSEFYEPMTQCYLNELPENVEFNYDVLIVEED